MLANYEIEYVSGRGTNSIYLLDNNNYLVKAKILLTGDKKEKVKKLINNLIVDNSNIFPDVLKGTIPENTRILNIEINDNVVTIDFSKDILNVSKNIESRMVESIVYSILSIDNINGVILKIEGEILGNLPNSKVKLPSILTKDIGINKEYNITKRNDIGKVVVYYLEDIEDVKYYVPVTKYLNDKRDKIKIIIDSLTTNYIYEPNLQSLLNKDLKVNSYSIEENVMLVDFNNCIFTNDKKIEEEVIYSISYSIFDNYNVKSVVYTVENNAIKTIKKKDLS